MKSHLAMANSLDSSYCDVVICLFYAMFCQVGLIRFDLDLTSGVDQAGFQGLPPNYETRSPPNTNY